MLVYQRVFKKKNMGIFTYQHPPMGGVKKNPKGLLNGTLEPIWRVQEYSKPPLDTKNKG